MGALRWTEAVRHDYGEVRKLVRNLGFTDVERDRIMNKLPLLTSCDISVPSPPLLPPGHLPVFFAPDFLKSSSIEQAD